MTSAKASNDDVPLRWLVAALTVCGLMVSACGSSEIELGRESVDTVSSKVVPNEPESIQPLLIAISVHVEGWSQEARNQDMFGIHRDNLLGLAEEVAAGGGVLTFELSDVFMEAVAVWNDDILDQFVALGHSVAVHADAGGSGAPTFAALTETLRQKRQTLADLGIVTEHVSGICSTGPWVEAALAAGFTSTNGGVAYCAASMAPELVAPQDQWVFECQSPADCHGAPPVSEDRRYHPFYVDSSTDWMVSEATEGLLVISSESGHSLACLDRSSPGEDDKCIATEFDLEVVSDTLDEYLAARVPQRTTALVYSWSIGNLPEPGFGAELVATFAETVSAGEAIWVGAGEIDEGPVAEETVAAVEQVPIGLSTMISIHTHLDRDWQPYTDESMTEIDTDLLEATSALITSTVDLLNGHGLFANFQMSYGVAGALCDSTDGQAIVAALLAAGHEIGIHTHGSEFFATAYDALVDGCGVTPVTASGIQFSIAVASDPQSGAQEWLREVEALGMSTVLAGLGLSPNPQSFVCDTYDGETADRAANGLLHSWLAEPDDICLSDPSGTLAIVTHSDRDTRALAGADTSIDNIDVDDFTVWGAQLDEAIVAADAASTWGIVMALPAMMVDGRADPAVLAAFDTFLGELAIRAAIGEIVSVTASQAGSLLR
ncbi:MAG: hypothetical protein P8L46_07500 [Acidimicrobiales bacterium]|nr:hypothetical protein [Acidimicrobiales bacterium]MDG2217876.1 hypothetical protein [Acidimicrobiales bacterium]